jgi:hypothetical protein
MKYSLSLIIVLVAIVSCNDVDAPEKDCLETTEMGVRQIVIPDSARVSEPMHVEVEVVRPDLNTRYVGTIVNKTEFGCEITIKGEINRCEMGYPAVVYEWHSFDIIPDKVGTYIVVGIGGYWECIADTTVVF